MQLPFLLGEVGDCQAEHDLVGTLERLKVNRPESSTLSKRTRLDPPADKPLSFGRGARYA
jgi:hypothetical protein